MTKDDIKPDMLKASFKTFERSEDKIELTVRLSNSSNRALHYISDVRAIRYDPGTNTLTVSLSDEGREIIPGAIQKLPVFRHIDPGSEAEIRLSVPNKIIKLVKTAIPNQIAFEKHQLSNVEEVVIEIAWSDVPYYKDTRAKDTKQLPAARWEQHKARGIKRIKPGKKSKS